MKKLKSLFYNTVNLNELKQKEKTKPQPFTNKFSFSDS